MISSTVGRAISGFSGMVSLVAQPELRRVAVVGASLAGLRACETLRAEGFGGAITLIGAETHLPYDRPPLSKKLLAGEWEPDRIAPAQARRPRGARTGSPRSASPPPRSTSPPGRSCWPTVPRSPSTGWSSPPVRRRVAFPTRAPSPASTSCARSTTRCACAPSCSGGDRRVVVIGAGFIGLEVAATARGLGNAVTVLEGAAAPLIRGLGPEMGAAVAAVHEPDGIDVRCGVAVADLEHDGCPPGRRCGRPGRRDRRRHRRRTGDRLAGGQPARAARWRRLRRHAGRRTARGLRRRRPRPLDERAVRRGACASSTGPTPPSRAQRRPATCWPQQRAMPGRPTRRCRSSGATRVATGSSSSAAPPIRPPPTATSPRSSSATRPSTGSWRCTGGAAASVAPSG